MFERTLIWTHYIAKYSFCTIFSFYIFVLLWTKHCAVGSTPLTQHQQQQNTFGYSIWLHCMGKTHPTCVNQGAGERSIYQTMSVCGSYLSLQVKIRMVQYILTASSSTTLRLSLGFADSVTLLNVFLSGNPQLEFNHWSYLNLKHNHSSSILLLQISS